MRRAALSVREGCGRLELGRGRAGAGHCAAVSRLRERRRKLGRCRMKGAACGVGWERGKGWAAHGRTEGEKEVSWARVVGPAGLLVGPSGERGKGKRAGLTGLETGFWSSFFLFLFYFQPNPNLFEFK